MCDAWERCLPEVIPGPVGELRVKDVWNQLVAEENPGWKEGEDVKWTPALRQFAQIWLSFCGGPRRKSIMNFFARRPLEKHQLYVKNKPTFPDWADGHQVVELTKEHFLMQDLEQIVEEDFIEESDTEQSGIEELEEDCLTDDHTSDEEMIDESMVDLESQKNFFLRESLSTFLLEKKLRPKKNPQLQKRKPLPKKKPATLKNPPAMGSGKKKAPALKKSPAAPIGLAGRKNVPLYGSAKEENAAKGRSGAKECSGHDEHGNQCSEPVLYPSAEVPVCSKHYRQLNTMRKVRATASVTGLKFPQKAEELREYLELRRRHQSLSTINLIMKWNEDKNKPSEEANEEMQPKQEETNDKVETEPEAEEKNKMAKVAAAYAKEQNCGIQ